MPRKGYKRFANFHCDPEPAAQVATLAGPDFHTDVEYARNLIALGLTVEPGWIVDTLEAHHQETLSQMETLEEELEEYRRSDEAHAEKGRRFLIAVVDAIKAFRTAARKPDRDKALSMLEEAARDFDKGD